MEIQTLEIKTSIYVRKPAAEIFEAIVDPSHMSRYFIREGSGRMEDGKEVIWQFPEFDDRFPVHIVKVLPSEYICFQWETDGLITTVEIRIQEKDVSCCQVIVTEAGHALNAVGIKWLRGNTEGWANFLACLKAYLEYGINLREGAFKM